MYISYIYIHIYTQIYTYIYMYIYIYIYTYIYKYIHVYISTHVSECMCVYISTHVSECMCVCVFFRRHTRTCSNMQQHAQVQTAHLQKEKGKRGKTQIIPSEYPLFPLAPPHLLSGWKQIFSSWQCSHHGS